MRSVRAWLTAAIITLAMFLGLVALVGCANNSPAADRFGLEQTDIEAYVVMDSVTGVYYMVLEDGAGIAVTPLLNPDGTPSRVDDADMDDVRADISANMRRWQEGTE